MGYFVVITRTGINSGVQFAIVPFHFFVGKVETGFSNFSRIGEGGSFVKFESYLA